jgi:hypothetical protein
MYDDDAEFVTKGLNNFSLSFINNNSSIYEFKENTARLPSGPYTNIIGFSLNLIRNNDIFQKYLREINLSNKIYQQRWGDLPIWGEVIYYIFGKDTCLINKNIKYHHGSHNKQVN